MLDARRPQSVSHLAAADPKLAAVIDSVGPYRMSYMAPNFASLARSVVFQQLNGAAAATIFGRLAAACPDGEPTPEAILRLRMDHLRKAGLSGQKAAYLRDMARLTACGRLDFAGLPRLTDEEVVERLTEVRGVGVWTAHMFLMFALRRPDVLPTGDYGIRTAMQRLYDLAALPKPAEMVRLAEPWRPWRSIACWYLWRSLGGPIVL